MVDDVISTRVLVEAMLDENATIDAGDLYAVGNALGMSDQQIRLTVKRLVAEGQFTVAGRGRTAVLTATGAVIGAVEPDRELVRLMYAQDRGEAPWDGIWHLAGFAVPESERESRAVLREAMLALGGAPVQGGLYVSPHAWEDDLHAAAGDAGRFLTTLTCTDLTVGGRTGADVAAHLWPLDAVAAGHDRLTDRARQTLDRTAEATRTERLALTVVLVAEFARAHEDDPLLPRELLPAEWVGARARGLADRALRALASAEPDSPLRLLRWYDAL
ncbi:putative repressor in the phenylacetic acid catabolism [Gordonia spumicola]|uniref:Putative repressor in the phenylacetic acid catabolism n=1 Tax=Gordonia spumicola TaxID=589161 RepID=A0A7I9VEE9_9ACTN|nr:PaaX family transcriptional regulator C-terminal domain-containing protein [Gordonia spumicola]GEE03697.1 putative repressor in the phenylacetic acid catabolism [Gordonia spumicola]